MKTATIPAVRVEADFREQLESVLGDGESLSEFVEAAVRAGVERRRLQSDFIARGLRSRDAARQTGEYVEAEEAVAGLEARLAAARLLAGKKRK